MSSKVVIIGGGLSAKHAAETLKKTGKDLTVTIVQANRFVEWPLAMTVCLVKPELHDKALAVNPDKFQVPGVTYMYGVAESVDPTTKTIKLAGNDETVAYDALIVATGFDMPLVYPGLGVTLEARKEEVRTIGKAIGSGACVVVAGGGPSGLELVGDIRAAHPQKKVVLLCKDKILTQWPENYRKKVEAGLKKMNIEVVSGATNAPTACSLEPGKLALPSGELAYDVFLPAYSKGPNTAFLPESVKDTKGHVAVNAYLQSASSEAIFAVGVSNVNEPFVGMPKLEAQWTTVAANVIAMLASKPLRKHREGNKFMKLPPLVLIGHGAKAYGFIDFDNVPPPLNSCCCCGYGGFPCCPPCWPCCACGGCGCCPLGLCCGAPEGKGPAIFAGKMAFMSAGMHFKGIGDVSGRVADAPPQQSMGEK